MKFVEVIKFKCRNEGFTDCEFMKEIWKLEFNFIGYRIRLYSFKGLYIISFRKHFKTTVIRIKKLDFTA